MSLAPAISCFYPKLFIVRVYLFFTVGFLAYSIFSFYRNFCASSLLSLVLFTVYSLVLVFAPPSVSFYLAIVLYLACFILFLQFDVLVSLSLVVIFFSFVFV